MAGSCLADSGWQPRVFHPQQLVILFRLAFRRFSTEAYTSTLRCCSGRNWSKFWGTQNLTRSNPQLNVSTSLADSHSSSQAATAREIQGRSLMECETVSGARDSSRRHPEATHEVLSWTRSCEPAAQKSPKIAQIFRFTRGSLMRRVHHR